MEDAMSTEPAPRPGRLDEIPVIDLADSDVQSVARKVRHACENSAFFYIANHGVAPEVVEGAFSVARTFFQLPLEEKMKVYKSRFHRGYLPLGTTQYPGQKKDLKASFDFGVDLPLDDPDVVAGVPLHGPNQWPDMPGFRAALEAYSAGVNAAGMKLMRVLAISLDLEQDFFTKFYSKPSILSRVIHYPKPEEADSEEFGIGALTHTDYGHITILAQDPAGGLEVQLPGGEWIAAPYVQDTFVVNLGDLTARWTNDVYRSNPHRVVNRLNRDRMSIPTFMNPNHRAVVACIPTCTGPGNPPKYEPVLAGDYVSNKIRANQGYKAPGA
jgi:isopenicillin N synthase-like dioxygenase